MKTNKTNISKSIGGFNKLSQNKQEYIIQCLKANKSIELNNVNILTPEDVDLFKKLKNLVLETIENNPDKQNVIKKLTLAGFEENVAELFYKYFVKISKPLKDAEVVRTMSEEQFRKIIDITLKRFFIYVDANFYSNEFIANEVGLNNSTELTKAIRFLAHYIYQVSGRSMSPEMLKYRMEKEFEIPEELTTILYKCVIDNLFQMQQAYLLSQVNSLNLEIKKINSILDKLNLNEESESLDDEVEQENQDE